MSIVNDSQAEEIFEADVKQHIDFLIQNIGEDPNHTGEGEILLRFIMNKLAEYKRSIQDDKR